MFLLDGYRSEVFTQQEIDERFAPLDPVTPYSLLEIINPCTGKLAENTGTIRLRYE
jgi:hypothetical protein